MHHNSTNLFLPGQVFVVAYFPQSFRTRNPVNTATVSPNTFVKPSLGLFVVARIQHIVAKHQISVQVGNSPHPEAGDPSTHFGLLYQRSYETLKEQLGVRVQDIAPFE